MARPRTRYARSGDVHLAYQVIGDGPRDVVFVLDWASHLEVLWEQGFVQDVIYGLARFARVLCRHARHRPLRPRGRGGRRGGGLDATVLFVDVAGSTEWVSELGDRRWRALLERFEETVQQALDAHRGELKNRAGDGVLATFDGPARAIRCAAQIRDSVRQSGLDVHCGLHVGEVTRRNGDVAGMTVHIGARVSSVAGPGEVLVTRTVRDLLAGSGIVFDGRGVHDLKGVPEQWALYAASG